MLDATRTYPRPMRVLIGCATSCVALTDKDDNGVLG